MTSSRSLEEAALGAIADYSTSEILASLAALQLVPGNSWATLRLETLVRLAVSREFTPRSKVRLTRHRLGRLVEADWLEVLVGFVEDPPETLSTAAVSFDGGSYVVFPGNYPDVVFIAQHVIKALFRCTQDFPDSQFFQEAYSFTRGVLRASHNVATNAGLVRGIGPGDTRQSIHIPDSRALAVLAEAVRLPAALLGAEPVSLGGLALASLASVPGEFAFERDLTETSGVLLRPLVDVRDSLVLVAPGSLLAAYVHQLLLRSIASGTSNELGRRVGHAVWDTVKCSMRVLGNQFISEHDASVDGLPEGAYEGVFRADIDKITYVLTVGDSLDDYGADGLQDSWDMGGLVDLAVRHMARTVEYFHSMNPDSRMLCVLVVQGIGRVGVAGVAVDCLPGSVEILEMSAADLECIAHLEHGDPLALWKFADARVRSRARLRLVNMSGTLNEYAMYRSSGHSLSFRQASPGTTVLISPGESLSARAEFQRMYDAHAVPSYDDEHVEEVIRRHQWGDIPIYWRRDSEDERTACMVAGYALPIWVVGPEAKTSFDAAISSEIVDAVSYWLWQFTPSLRVRIDAIADYRSSLCLWLSVPDERAWLATMAESESNEVADVLTYDSDEPGEIRLDVSAELARCDVQGDNSADRALMRGVVGALWSHLRRLGEDVVDDEVIRIIDKHAPLGAKKKLFFLRGRDAAMLHDAQLPPVRRVQEADASAVNEWIGERLADDGQLKVGRVAASSRKNLLNHVVGNLYEELRRSIRRLSGDHLLEILIAHNESLVRQRRFADMTLATERACYRDEKDMIRKRGEDLENLTKASIASRFLIEYVAARPPRGASLLSLGGYDRLLALSARLHELARLSDWIEYLDADVVVEIAPSGQLVDTWSSGVGAMDQYVDAIAAQELHRAAQQFSPDRDEDSAEYDEERPTRLNTAMQAEFEFTGDEIASFVNAALRIRDDTASVSRLEMSAFISTMAAQVGWSERRVRKLLSLLSLKRRRSYLDPASPFSARDVYPSLFNRRLSYIRRPFIVRPPSDGTSDVVWGPRNLQLSWVNLGGLILGGRLVYKSREMERFIQSEAKKASADFVRSAAQMFSSIEGAVVRTNVSRVPGAGELLQPHGDIDVLAATPRGRLFICECKCVGQGRTPRELRNETEAFLKKNKGHIARHQRRVEWARREVASVAAWLGLQRRSRWSVEGLVLVDTELMVAYMGQSALPIESLDSCRWELEQHGKVLGRTP